MSNFWKLVAMGATAAAAYVIAKEVVERHENGEDCYEAVEDDELVDILFEKFLAQQEEDFEEFDGTEDEDSAEE